MQIEMELLNVAASRLLIILGFLCCFSNRARANGNVTAFVDANGNLMVIGDELDNSLRITHEDACLTLSGVFPPPVTSTTINGLPRFELQTIVPRIIIALNDGDDLALFDELGLAQTELIVEGGSGSDRILFGVFSTHGDTHFDLGPGDDTLAGEAFHLSGNAFIDAGTGNDYIHFQSSSAGGTGRMGKFTLGPGLDEFLFFSSESRGLIIDAGEGADLVRLGLLTGIDQGVLETGAGEDRLEILGGLTIREGSLSVDTGSDADHVFISDSINGWLTVSTGSGDDRINVTNSSVDTGVNLYLDEGSDRLTVTSSIFSSKGVSKASSRYELGSGLSGKRPLVLHGGPGIDLFLTGIDNQFRVHPIIANFEIVSSYRPYLARDG